MNDKERTTETKVLPSKKRVHKTEIKRNLQYLSCMKLAVTIESDDIFINSVHSSLVFLFLFPLKTPRTNNDPSCRQSLPLHHQKVVFGLISLALFLILAHIGSWFLKSSNGSNPPGGLLDFF